MKFLFLLLFFLFYSAFGEYDRTEAINSKKCIELCNHCGGTGSYVDNSCECYIENDSDEEGECFDRMKRKARQWNLDLINCKRGLSDRPSRCNYQNSRRIGSYDMCRIAQYFLSGGPSKRVPIVKPKCDPTTTTSPGSTEPTVIKTIIDDCDDMEDECNPGTERPTEDPCEKYKPTPRPIEHLEPHYDYPKPSYRSYNPSYHASPPLHGSIPPLHGSIPPSYSSFHNSLYQGNNQHYSPQFSSFGSNLQHTGSPYDAMRAKHMEEMMGRNYYNSLMDNQSYRNKINGYNYNAYSTNGYTNAMFPINSNNYMQSLYASTNNNNNYQVDSAYSQSMSINDLLELQRFLANQNSMMQPLLQRLQLQSNSQVDSNYLPFNVMVGAANPSSTDNTRNQENTTPGALTSLGSSNDETVVSSSEGNDNPMPMAIVEETVTGQVGAEENSDSSERSRRVIRPLYHNGRRIAKRGFRL